MTATINRLGLSATFIAATVALAAFATPASALEVSGRAAFVAPAVDATGPGGKRMIELKGAVFMGDEIVANPKGRAQIIFIDQTTLEVGPSSRVKIDTFVFNPDYTAKQVTVNVLRGSFRFISGKSPASAYSINTPAVTVGIRG